MDFKVEIGLRIELKIRKNYFQIELKIQKKKMKMTWLLTWLNMSIATLNAMLHLLVIYKLVFLKKTNREFSIEKKYIYI